VNWVDPALKKEIPAFAFYTGDSTDQRELMRQIFNGPSASGQYESGFPQSLIDTIKEKKLCILMGTKAAAEGIDLKLVRNVFITEPHWNPARIEQAIGRAIRICSHATLPLEDRTVKVRIYITVFTPEQTTTQEGPNITVIRRNDMDMKRYEGEAKEAFLTSDEYLYEISYRKNRVIKNISHLLKQAAVDCEIHRKLHSKEQPVIQCMRFDTTVGSEDLAFKPRITQDETDSLYLKNIQRKSRRLQKIKVKGSALLIDPDTNEIFDLPSFDDTKRLIRLGKRISAGEIRFFAPVSKSNFSST
jgi:superfamily II DNA or RNA helicase